MFYYIWLDFDEEVGFSLEAQDFLWFAAFEELMFWVNLSKLVTVYGEYV